MTPQCSGPRGSASSLPPPTGGLPTLGSCSSPPGCRRGPCPFPGCSAIFHTLRGPIWPGPSSHLGSTSPSCWQQSLMWPTPPPSVAGVALDSHCCRPDSPRYLLSPCSLPGPALGAPGQGWVRRKTKVRGKETSRRRSPDLCGTSVCACVHVCVHTYSEVPTEREVALALSLYHSPLLPKSTPKTH